MEAVSPVIEKTNPAHHGTSSDIIGLLPALPNITSSLTAVLRLARLLLSIFKLHYVILTNKAPPPAIKVLSFTLVFIIMLKVVII